MSDSLTKPTLPSFSWIGHLKDDDRDLLSSYGEFFPGLPGNVIIEEGAMQTEVFVVISGQLEVRAKQEDGTELLLAQVGPGETLGEISLFDPGPAAATVTAVEFSQLWRIADSDLMEFMQQNPGAGNVLLRTLASILAQRLRQMNPKAFGLSAYGVVGTPELETTEPERAEAEAAAALEATSVPAEPTPEPAPEVESVPPVVVLPPAAKTPVSPTPQRGNKRLGTKTQLIPNPDEADLEPL